MLYGAKPPENLISREAPPPRSRNDMRERTKPGNATVGLGHMPFDSASSCSSCTALLKRASLLSEKMDTPSTVLSTYNKVTAYHLSHGVKLGPKVQLENFHNLDWAAG